ncbi:receptor expression-enhancing protein 1 isoform X2 [Clupea harengus]|uniref:Receptor expression-enhancing protein n=1 Tax=Clupea harengus TaxID=7950 RepID=A0A6P8GEW5_CLUHA|nr:receptor expression-enhancing protein 1 isoform X2 [Clupea harengus]
MVSWIISRLVVLVFGTLYPAYSSYKAVKSKDVREYVKWMMYWIIFALFTTAEVLTDIFLYWVPFYYELKIAFVVWLLSPYTKGSSVLYRKFVHPTLSSKEKDIDEYLNQAKDKSYDTLVHYGRKGLNVAATAAVMAASKGQGVLSDRLRSFSMQDLASLQAEGGVQPPGPAQPGPGQSRTRATMRSKSESGYTKGLGQEFDEPDFELLSLEQNDPAEPPYPQSPSPPPPSPPARPRPDPPTPTQPLPPELAEEATSDPHAPSDPTYRQPPPRPLRPITRSRSKSSLSGGEVM